MNGRDIVQQLRDEGRREGHLEGRREALLWVYRARFGAVPRKVRAAIERNNRISSLKKWSAMFAVRSAAQIAPAVAAQKAKPRLSSRRAS
jgi:hypothetical protein